MKKTKSESQHFNLDDVRRAGEWFKKNIKHREKTKEELWEAKVKAQEAWEEAEDER